MKRSLLVALVGLSACDGQIVGPWLPGQTNPGGNPVGGGNGAAGGGAVGVDPGVQVGCEAATFQLTRLNRREIDESLARLLGDTVQPARFFSADNVNPDLFDNTAAQLSIAPRLVVDLEAAVGKVIDDVWARDAALLASAGSTGGATGGTGGSGYSQTQLGKQAQASVGQANGDAWNLWSNGEAKFAFNVPTAASYELTLTVWGAQAGTEPVAMDVWLNGTLAKSFTVPGTQGAPNTLTLSSALPAGAVTVGLRFTNDVYDPATQLDRNLFIGAVKLTGAGGTGSTPPPSTAQKPFVRSCTPATAALEPSCASELVLGLARKAWRRAPTDDERSALIALYSGLRKDGDDFETSVKVTLRSVLLAPAFLMRTEAVVPENGPRSTQAVASRLAFFLWAGPPDAALDKAADDGTLADPTVLTAQVTRMMADPRAENLKHRLVGQWFETEGIEGFSLDPALFPGATPKVLQAVQRQIDAYLAEYFFSDRDVLDALDAKVTYVDQELAGFLGLSAPGQGLQRITLAANDPRTGLLGQSAPLIVTSKSTETNPPRRGKWVLERLLCQSVPLPADIDIPPVPPATATQPTARDRLEALTSPAACQGCHARLNPIGFGLENFAADSRFRTQDHGATIDPKGTFLGKPIDGLASLATALKSDPQLERCLVNKTLSFAIARPLSSMDSAQVDLLQQRFVAGGRRFTQLVSAVAQSPLVVNGCRPTTK